MPTNDMLQKILSGGFITILLGIGAILIDSARTQNVRIVALHTEMTARMDSMQISINGRIDKLYETQTQRNDERCLKYLYPQASKD